MFMKHAKSFITNEEYYEIKILLFLHWFGEVRRANLNNYS